MNKNKDEIFDEIEEILEKNEDARKGYQKASENARNNALGSYFSKKSRDRTEFNSKLRSEISSVYMDFNSEGSFMGSVHRAWMDVKSMFSANDDESMLEESIRGDKAAIEEYNDVIKYENLPMSLKNLLMVQRDEIMKDIAIHNSMERFK